MASQLTIVNFSEYYHSLDGPSKQRYREKVSNIGLDPYALKKADFCEDLARIPRVEYPDIVNYLVLQTSWATNQQMKAYKSMDAYNFFVSGWVNTLQMKEINGEKVVVFARVNHSQRARDTPLKTWIFAENNGTILTAHCDCMAGLSEACSHIGAILFACETGARMQNSVTCTGAPNKWLMPSYVKDIPYVPVSEMDMKSAKRKNSLLSGNGQVPTTLRHVPGNNPRTVKPTPEEQHNFFLNISQCGSKPVILSLIEPFSDLYVPKGVNLPKPLTEMFFEEDSTNSDFHSLLLRCDEINIQISNEECQHIESCTREQSNCNLWFKQRAGRITASKLKSVCHTSIEKPSHSLIKNICYPESYRFTNDATKWGIKNEDTARKLYASEMERDHEGFIVSDSGFHINPQWPYMGASPDGLVNCKCCGSGACEIKCPFTARHLHPIDAAEKIKGFCVKKVGQNGLITLDKKHSYYYQIQAQLYICSVDYCDFIVWTPKGLFIERITPDTDFWAVATKEAREFFYRGILPEIVGRWFTQARVPSTQASPASDDDDAYWCICQQHIEDSTLIRCDNKSCSIKWYHIRCVQLKEIPEEKWLCPQCYSKSDQATI